jgi:hypothetical protein
MRKIEMSQVSATEHKYFCEHFKKNPVAFLSMKLFAEFLRKVQLSKIDSSTGK